MIKAVVFDLDGVYFENGTATFIKNLGEKYGLSEEVIKDVYLRSNEMQLYKEGRMSGDDFWNFATSRWQIRTSTNVIINLLIDGYRENAETVEFIRNIRSRGIKTAVCTNNFRERLEGLETRFHFKQWFDVVVASYEQGIRKPDPRMFTVLAERLQLQPSEILMSDDREVNVESLTKLGFTAFLYTTLDDFKAKISAVIQ